MVPTLLGLDRPQVWNTELAFEHLKALGEADSKRTAERRLHELGLLPEEISLDSLADEQGRRPTPSVLDWESGEARAKRERVLFAQLAPLPGGRDCLHANDARGARFWIPLPSTNASVDDINKALRSLHDHLGKPLAIFPHGRLAGLCRKIANAESSGLRMMSYPPVLDLEAQACRAVAMPSSSGDSHLSRLEAESIFILREAVAEAENPAMLYSLGKDSSVMLHLARKAFYPSPPPFPLLHVDTRWKFQEMYLFRDHIRATSGMDLLAHVNPDAVARDINPFDHGSALHTDITKTEGLKQALDKHGFDVVFGGARRDEEKSRAKERVFSFRSRTHRWDPKSQRPELWNLFNTRKGKGESIRVFPLSNWTELDIWLYILREGIPLVPLYFAKERPVVERDGMLILVDDARLRLLPGEPIHKRKVRFRTLGCYPLSGAIESEATSVQDIVLELISANNSERAGRAIDADSAGSMEKKKQEGYF